MKNSVLFLKKFVHKLPYENWLRFLCQLFLSIYRMVLSPHLGGACRFFPSCSHYSERVLLSYPLITAIFLILKRLSFCHFWGPWGWDPVPSPSLLKKNRICRCRGSHTSSKIISDSNSYETKI